jgi:hypothetical protein
LNHLVAAHQEEARHPHPARLKTEIVNRRLATSLLRGKAPLASRKIDLQQLHPPRYVGNGDLLIFLYFDN